MDKDTHLHPIDRQLLKTDEYRSLRQCLCQESIEVELGGGGNGKEEGRNTRGLRKAEERREKVHLRHSDVRRVCE